MSFLESGSVSYLTVPKLDSNQLKGIDLLPHKESINRHQGKGQDGSQSYLHSFGAPFWMRGNFSSLSGVRPMDTSSSYGVAVIGEKRVKLNHIHIEEERESILMKESKGYDTSKNTYPIVGNKAV
ncbi:hypothetical protein [Risungbinella massiliensis]|uniref:hypothetical protein n=1 Tax=Risungbinella massiliensis TaxID=1329796 RepID=UPI0005CBD869|nr:hypothetical protein [Risungbinella massiliensis]